MIITLIDCPRNKLNETENKKPKIKQTNSAGNGLKNIISTPKREYG